MDKKLEIAMENLKASEKTINSASKTKPKTMERVITEAQDTKPQQGIPQEHNVEPTLIEKQKQSEANISVKLSSTQQKLRKFIELTNAVYAQNPGTPYEKWYATSQAWSYLATLNGAHTRITQIHHSADLIDANAVTVYAEGELVDDATGDVITRGATCASTNEDWLKGKPLSATYGLAQTRLEERLLKNRFGYQLSLAHLEPVGAEELDVDIARYGTRDKEI